MQKGPFPKDHRSYLLSEYEARLQRRPAYSKRAFARDLRVSPASLTEFLKGKTTFSPARIKEISKIIRLDDQQIEHWLDLVNLEFSKNAVTKLKAKTKITARFKSLKAQRAVEKYKVASDWECWAYLELLEIDKKAQDDQYSAKWLGITTKHLAEIKSNLLDLEIIAKTHDKGYQRTAVADVFGGETSSSAVRNYHRRLLDKAKEAVDEQDFERRFLSSVILSLPKEKLKSLFTELEGKIYESLIQASSVENKDSIYCFSFQLYDLGKRFK